MYTLYLGVCVLVSVCMLVYWEHEHIRKGMIVVTDRKL